MLEIIPLTLTLVRMWYEESTPKLQAPIHFQLDLTRAN